MSILSTRRRVLFSREDTTLSRSTEGSALALRMRRCHTYDMTRTTIVADDEIIARLKGLARDRKVSFSEVVREALEAKAAEYRPRPRSLGSGSSEGPGTRDGGRVPPRSWR